MESLISAIKKLTEIEIGAISLTEEKLISLIKELEEKGNLSEGEGKKYLDNLKETLKKKQAELHKQTRSSINQVLKSTDFVIMDDFNKLKERVDKLETEVEELKKSKGD